jgi:hypothetical protein
MLAEQGCGYPPAEPSGRTALELAQGTRALRDRLGAEVAGYRSPCWELTPQSLAMLAEQRFRYDSSCMGDDRPYYATCGQDQILEFPIHWSLDDWPCLAWHPAASCSPRRPCLPGCASRAGSGSPATTSWPGC